MRLELDACVLRSWEPGDAESLARHADSREIWRNLRDGFPHPYHLEDAVGWIDTCLGQEPETNFAIEVEGQTVGGIGLILGSDVERITAEVGYWLGKACWGRGVMTEALVAFRDYSLQRYSLTRLHARTYDWNPGSARVLEKSGFEYEGRLRRSALKDGQIIDQLLYAYVVPDDKH